MVTPNASEDATPPRRRRRPWWIPHFLGGVPDLEPRFLTLLGLVAVALLFEQYDVSMLTAALKFIAEDLGIAESSLGAYMGVIRLGALPAFVLIMFADRLGRRRLFLLSVVGTSVATLATALSQTAWQFVVVQTIARMFLGTGLSVSFVIVTEEFPAAHRGWGIGMLGALSACGHGLGALLFAIIHVLPYGWRALYCVGVLPLLLLPRLRRELLETRRFTRHRDAQIVANGPSEGWSGWWTPMLDLARTHPWRAFGVGAMSGLMAFGGMPVFQFLGYFTLTVHGWAPWQFSAMVFFGGGVGILGNVVAGRLGDRVGRRIVGMVIMTAIPIFVSLFYNGPGWMLPPAWVCLVFCTTAGDVVVRALSTELFPTSHRGAAAGWSSLLATLGAAAGLGLVGLGTHAPGDLAFMITLLSLGNVVAAFFLLFVPETHGRELEAINPEDTFA